MTEFVLGGIAACCAGVFTNPLEVIKTRMQLQGELKARGLHVVHYRNSLHAMYAVATKDGILALQKGLAPALWYQLTMNGIRLGTYQTIVNLELTKTKNGDVSIVKSAIAGAAAGCVGAFIGSPMYLVKTHFQAQAAKDIAVGHQHDHKSMTSALRNIYSKHGIKGLWRGVTAAIPRVTVGSASQLSSFSKTKQFVDNLKIFPADSWMNALLASMISGLVVSVCMTPFDVVSTRLYNQGLDAQGRGLFYSGYLDCWLKIVRTEGIFGFYKGFTASYLRLGPHTILSLVFWSELRRIHLKTLERKNSTSHTDEKL